MVYCWWMKISNWSSRKYRCWSQPIALKSAAANHSKEPSFQSAIRTLSISYKLPTLTKLQKLLNTHANYSGPIPTTSSPVKNRTRFIPCIRVVNKKKSRSTGLLLDRSRYYPPGVFGADENIFFFCPRVRITIITSHASSSLRANWIWLLIFCNPSSCSLKKSHNVTLNLDHCLATISFFWVTEPWINNWKKKRKHRICRFFLSSIFATESYKSDAWKLLIFFFMNNDRSWYTAPFILFSPFNWET